VRALVSLIEDDQAAIAWRWSCMRNSPESSAPRFNASWTKRTKPAPIPKPCAATLPSSWWRTKGRRQHEGCESTFAVTLTAIHQQKTQQSICLSSGQESRIARPHRGGGPGLETPRGRKTTSLRNPKASIQASFPLLQSAWCGGVGRASCNGFTSLSAHQRSRPKRSN